MVASHEKLLAAKQKEVLAYQEKYNIRVRGEGEGGASSSAAKPDGGSGGGPQGVLVGG